MSLNRELKILYGYRLNGMPITTYIDKLYECDDVKTQCEMLDSIITPDENNFVVCTDGMLCKYEYAGLLCYSSNCEENFSISYDLDEIKKLINKKLLDKCIKERLPWILNKENECSNLILGESPKIWIFETIW